MERQAFVDAALAVIGLGANPHDKEKLQAYTDLIAPKESAQKIHDMLLMSGCGLTVAGIWRKAGVVNSVLSSPYVIGSAISRLTVLAHHCGAWVNFSKGKYPDLGDMVLIGDNGAGGIEHVYTVVSSDGSGGLESVDGGQRDSGLYQVILRKKHLWKDQRDISYIGSDPGSAALGGRRIYGWVDCTKLPSH